MKGDIKVKDKKITYDTGKFYHYDDLIKMGWSKNQIQIYFNPSKNNRLLYDKLHINKSCEYLLNVAHVQKGVN